MGCSDGLVTLQFLSARDIPSATYVIGNNPYLQHFFLFSSLYITPVLSFPSLFHSFLSCSLFTFFLFLASSADFIVNAIIRNKIHHDGNCS